MALDREDCHVALCVDVMPRRTDGRDTDPDAETVSFSFAEARGSSPRKPIACRAPPPSPVHMRTSRAGATFPPAPLLQVASNESQFVAAVKKAAGEQRKLMLRAVLMLPGRQSSTGVRGPASATPAAQPPSQPRTSPPTPLGLTARSPPANRRASPAGANRPLRAVRGDVRPSRARAGRPGPHGGALRRVAGGVPLQRGVLLRGARTHPERLVQSVFLSAGARGSTAPAHRFPPLLPSPQEAATRYMGLWLLSPLAEEVRFANAAAVTRKLVRLLRGAFAQHRAERRRRPLPSRPEIGPPLLPDPRALPPPAQRAAPSPRSATRSLSSSCRCGPCPRRSAAAL